MFNEEDKKWNRRRAIFYRCLVIYFIFMTGALIWAISKLFETL